MPYHYVQEDFSLPNNLNHQQSFLYSNHIKEEYVDTSKNPWGPHFWTVMHTVAFSFSDNPTLQERQAAHNFFTSLQHLLPCPKCRRHCQENLSKTPPDTTNRDTLSRWSVNFHNEVNKCLNKPIKTYEEVRPMYEQQYQSYCKYSK